MGHASLSPDISSPETSSSTRDGPQEMFEYTSGRWIYNEALRKLERYLKFDIPALQHAAANAMSLDRTDIGSLVKFAEGGFNRIFQTTCARDGKEILIRLPFPFVRPKRYTVASEVATLEYLRLNGIPVPRVYGWSGSAVHKNAVGTEYIVLEKIQGHPLGDRWFSLGVKERYKVIEQIVRLEQKLFALDLPANGSIYFPDDLDEKDRSRAVPFNVGGRKFCIGPMAHYTWWERERSSMDCDRGPWHTSNALFVAVGQRELQWTKQYAKPRLHYERLYRALHGFQRMSPQPHIDALHKYLSVARCLGYPSNHAFNRPVLRHPDLQPNNILVSDSLDVVGLIDWQHATVVPLCLAAGMPHSFQNYGDPESERMAKPARDLPSDFGSLSPAEQEAAKDQHMRRWNHFLYAGLTLRHNEEHYNAIFNNGVIYHQRLYKHAGTPWEGDSITLEAELINAVQNWEDIVVNKSSECNAPPIQYSESSIKSITDMHRQQQEMDEVMGQMRDAIGTDITGWVPNERYSASKELAGTIKQQMIEQADPAERDGIRNHFPFDDFDEDG